MAGPRRAIVRHIVITMIVIVAVTAGVMVTMVGSTSSPRSTAHRLCGTRLGHVVVMVLMRFAYSQ